LLTEEQTVGSEMKLNNGSQRISRLEIQAQQVLSKMETRLSRIVMDHDGDD